MNKDSFTLYTYKCANQILQRFLATMMSGESLCKPRLWGLVLKHKLIELNEGDIKYQVWKEIWTIVEDGIKYLGALLTGLSLRIQILIRFDQFSPYLHRYVNWPFLSLWSGDNFLIFLVWLHLNLLQFWDIWSLAFLMDQPSPNFVSMSVITIFLRCMGIFEKGRWICS